MLKFVKPSDITPVSETYVDEDNYILQGTSEAYIGVRYRVPTVYISKKNTVIQFLPDVEVHYSESEGLKYISENWHHGSGVVTEIVGYTMDNNGDLLEVSTSYV